jgi:hypothetical protein
MTDQKFDDVVIEGQSTGYGKERGYRALCATCGEYQECRASEYERTDARGGKYIPHTVGEEDMAYVARMRAWNCCHEGEEPIDGFPDDPQDE